MESSYNTFTNTPVCFPFPGKRCTAEGFGDLTALAVVGSVFVLFYWGKKKLTARAGKTKKSHLK